MTRPRTTHQPPRLTTRAPTVRHVIAPLRPDPLARSGDPHLALQTKHSWLGMMTRHNATTTMECWDPDELPNLTFSHIWSASPAFIIPRLLVGIIPLLPGWSKVSIKPQPGRLTRFTFSQPTIRGPIVTQVTQALATGGGGGVAVTSFRMVASIPGNVVARLHVPSTLTALAAPNAAEARSKGCIRLNGVETIATRTEQQSHLWVEVGAGTHSVEHCD